MADPLIKAPPPLTHAEIIRQVEQWGEGMRQQLPSLIKDLVRELAENHQHDAAAGIDDDLSAA